MESPGYLLPLVVIAVGSLFYVAQAGVICDGDCPGKTAWAIACGSISLVLTLALALLKYFEKLQQPIIHTVCSVFLMLWWAVGAGVGTFSGPFQVPGNGYFAAWVAFAGSVAYLWLASEQSHAGLKATTVDTFRRIGYPGNTCIFFVSIVYLTAAATACSDASYCAKEFGWAVACAVIALFVSFVVIVFALMSPGALSPLIHTIIAGFFVVWFAAGAGVGTFDDPFQFTGNGYFSVWIGFFCSLWYFHEANQRRRGIYDDETATDNAQDEPGIIVSSDGFAGSPDGNYIITDTPAGDGSQNYQDSGFRPAEQI